MRVKWRRSHPCVLLVVLLFSVLDYLTICVEGFRGAFAPIQPVFSLAASSDDEKQQQQQQQKLKLQPTFVDFPGGTLEFSWHASIADIPAKVWDGCLPLSTDKKQTTGRSPFLEHAWLHSLEASGCVSNATGWIPQHLSIHIHRTTNGSTTSTSNSTTGVKKKTTKDTTKSTVLMDGCVPVYIKTHSMGEFIFDDSWADAAFRNGLDYYPKLLVGVPFTPVKGPRILWHSQVWDSISSPTEMDDLNAAVGTFLKQSASARGWSGVHINFCTNQEATALASPLEIATVTTESEDNDNTSSPEATNDDNDFGTNEEEDEEEDSNNKDIRQRLQAMLIRQLEHNDTNTYLRRTSLQYQWKNRNPQQDGSPFHTFEDYLSCFRSKRRITIRRERLKARQGEGSNSNTIRIDAISGADILKVDGLVERMFDIYISTVDKMFWGRQYLTLEFFQSLCRTPFVNNLCFLCVRYQQKNNEKGNAVKDSLENKNGKSVPWKAEDVFAGTFNVVKDGVFYGRYWGCLPGHEAKNLHFETCYWSAIDYCIEHGLKRMEPGAGGADYKWARGFDPQLIHSVHYICNPMLRRAVSQFVESETEYNVALKKHLMGKSAVAEREPQKG